MPLHLSSVIYHIRSIGENGTYDEIGWRKAASFDKAEITHISTHHTSLTILWKWPALWVIVCTCHTPQTILWIGMTRLWVIGDSQRVVFATNISVWHLFSKKLPANKYWSRYITFFVLFLEFYIFLPKTNRK